MHDDDSSERTALYRLYDSTDRLLYIGISRNPKHRWERHSQIQPWWHLVARKSLEWHEDRNSALAAEVQATTAEKPLYDQSSRRTQAQPRGGFDHSDGVQAVIEGLTLKIEAGAYPPGTRLSTGPVAEEYGVARTTASRAMRALTVNGLLTFRVHGRYLVAER
ncbi:GntR family transcriptional regulator [Streptomyces scopuliridis]|uniref:GntR family transcriptional regulator n=1 Tax=Streptomyces scopuliridis TaxID=452529 RepID=UPI0034383BFD